MSGAYAADPRRVNGVCPWRARDATRAQAACVPVATALAMRAARARAGYPLAAASFVAFAQSALNELDALVGQRVVDHLPGGP